MRTRGQIAGALLALAVVVAGGMYLDDLGPRAAGGGGSATVVSGTWLCPHGGDEDRVVEIVLANPGPGPVDVRVRGLSAKGSREIRAETLGPGSQVFVRVPAEAAEASSAVEYFGGWVAAGWIGRGGGVAAEPCLPEASSSWVVPDGTTLEGQDAFLVVMNPFEADAVVDVTLFPEEHEPVLAADLAHVLIRGQRSVSFRLNPILLGEPTVAAKVDAGVGRVAVASLGVDRDGGIRSSVGIPWPGPERVLLPGGGDAGQSSLVVANPGQRKVSFGATVFGLEELEGANALREAAQGAGSARTYPVVTDGPGAIEVFAGRGALASARRTIGVGSDQGSTAGETPAAAWVVLPTAAGRPSTARLYLANPGNVDAQVRLSFVDDREAAQTVTVPAGRTLGVSQDFAGLAPRAAVVAVAETGTFVPVSASSSLGKLGLSGYAVSVGIRIPARWVPG